MSQTNLRHAGRLAQHALDQGVHPSRVWDETSGVRAKTAATLDGYEDLSYETFCMTAAEKAKKTSKNPLDELLEDDSLQRLFQDEYVKRRPHYDTLRQGGRKYVTEIKKRQAYIAKIREIYQILSVKKAKNQTDRDRMAEIVNLQEKAEKAIGNISDTTGSALAVRETALYANLRKFLNYQKEYSEKHYIPTPTREEYMSDVMSAIRSGQSVLLSGETGTGKTLLAKEAIRVTLRTKTKTLPQGEGWYELDGEAFGERLKNSETASEVAGILESAHAWLQKNEGKTYKDFVEYYREHIEEASGHANMTTRELVGGSAIRAIPDGKGGKTMDTLMILGPLLRAFVEGKPILIDEIDMIPNDTLMRIKSLLTSRPGESYRAQEDTGHEVILRGCQIIATRNGSGERYGRSALDPAIMRLFPSKISIGYPPVHEQYDMIVARLMERTGTIAVATPDEISSEDGILVRFTTAVEEIRTRFILWEQEKSSKSKDTYLKSDVIDPGIINGWIDGYLAQVGTLSFTEFFQKQCLDWMLSIEDTRSRALVAKVFSTKGLISPDDLPAITESIYGKGRKLDNQMKKSLDDLTEGWFAGGARIESHSDLDPHFVDPYEIASLDPYDQYHFDLKLSGDELPLFTSLIQELGREVLSLGFIAREILLSHKDAKKISLTSEQVTGIFDTLLGDQATALGTHIELARRLSRIGSIGSMMSDALKERLDRLKKAAPAKSTAKNSTPNTSDFQSEHMKRTARILGELKTKYASQPNKMKFLNQMKLIEYTATSWPSHIGSQEEWDRKRATLTHDANHLPDYVPTIEYTGGDGIEKSLSLLTLCAPDSGTPADDPETEYAINHTENGRQFTYYSFGYVDTKKLPAPSKEDFQAFGWTTSSNNKEWHQDLMRLLGYFGDDQQITKWYHPIDEYKKTSAESSFWASSPGGDVLAGCVYANPGGARLGSARRQDGLPLLPHL